MPEFDPAKIFPEIGDLHAAISRRDWPTVSAFFADLSDEDERSFVVHAAREVAGSDHWLAELVASGTGSTLPSVLLAGRVITLAWQARTALRAEHVSREQFASFHDQLRRAERLLIDVTALEPQNAMAWNLRLITARGLELGQSEARRRYNRLAEHHPHHSQSQQQLLQQLCPKWGGSWDEMHAFARERMLAAPPGSLSAVLVVLGHLERWLDVDGGAKGEAYLRQPQVYHEIVEAAQRSVLAPAFRARFGWVFAHNAFAMILSLRGDHAMAAVHFRALGNAASEFPWGYLGDESAAFKRYRKAALAKG
jgi:hypothetical protein